jgi:hypothetical protein
MEHLLQKGVYVSEIESKKVATENKIEELDKKLRSCLMFERVWLLNIGRRRRSG